jgi:hypothetical protein
LDIPDAARHDAALVKPVSRTLVGPDPDPMLEAKTVGAHVDLLDFIRGGAPQAGPTLPGRSAPEQPPSAGDHSAACAAQIWDFVQARCVLDPRVWAYRHELWIAYADWAGSNRLCRNRDELEAPLLASRVVAIGLSSSIVAGIGLTEDWTGHEPPAAGGPRS